MHKAFTHFLLKMLIYTQSVLIINLFILAFNNEEKPETTVKEISSAIGEHVQYIQQQHGTVFTSWSSYVALQKSLQQTYNIYVQYIQYIIVYLPGIVYRAVEIRRQFGYLLTALLYSSNSVVTNSLLIFTKCEISQVFQRHFASCSFLHTSQICKKNSKYSKKNFLKKHCNISAVVVLELHWLLLQNKNKLLRKFCEISSTKYFKTTLVIRMDILCELVVATIQCTAVQQRLHVQYFYQ